MGTIVRLKPHGAFRREATALRRPTAHGPGWSPRPAGAFHVLITGAGLQDAASGNGGLEEMFASECRQCGRRYTPEGLRRPRVGQGGRPRQYCSNACRQKAYRERRR